MSSASPSTHRCVLRELVVLLAYLVGAAVFTYPLVFDFGRLVHDLADPLLDAWALSWVAHQLPREPLELFDANRYYPESGTLAFTDPMIAVAVLVAPVELAFDNPILTLNTAMLLSLSISGYGAYRLATHLSGSALAGGVAGSIFAFNPYRLSHLEHVNLQAAGFVPLLFLSIHRYLEEGRIRHAVGAGSFLWLVSASCAYYGVFTWTVLALFVPFEVWRTGTFARPRRLLGLALALVLSALAYLPLALPFMRLKQEFDFHRPVSRVARASARPHDYLRSGAHLHQAIGLDSPSPERTLFPGIAATSLGLLALFRPRSITVLYGLIGVFAAWASLGPAWGLYGALHALVPGVAGLRVPPRYAIYVMLALAVLAGLASGHLLRLVGGGKRRLLALAAALIAFPLVESYGGPSPYRQAPELPEVYRWLAARPEPAPIVELPLPEPSVEELHRNAVYLYWSTSHFKPLANGYSTVVPPVYAELTSAMKSFPDRESVEVLRQLGFRYIILHRDLYLRHRAAEMENAMNECEDLREVHRTDDETVYEVLR